MWKQSKDQALFKYKDHKIVDTHAHTLKPEPQKNENFLGSMSEK